MCRDTGSDRRKHFDDDGDGILFDGMDVTDGTDGTDETGIYFDNRSSTFRVICSTAGSFPRSP